MLSHEALQRIGWSLMIVDCHILANFLSELAMNVEIGWIIDCENFLSIFFRNLIEEIVLGIGISAFGHEG